tara:strand:- start:19 stop:462 length:444 start_codon:yes stop_codon:yes gene_type:complete
MTEELDWVNIPDTKHYITRCGKVRKIIKSGKVMYLKGSVGSCGYRNITINKKHYKLHRILGKLFIPNPENKPCIDHINRIRTDNRLENLRWATRSENNYNKTMKGCISKNNKSWRASIYDLNSKKITKTFKKKKDAEKWRDENLIQR